MKPRRPIRRSRWRPRPTERSLRVKEELITSRIAVLERSGGRCEASFSSYCSGVGTHLHHVLSRARGGSHGPENLLLVCALCHDEIHHHRPAEATARGLLRKRSA